METKNNSKKQKKTRSPNSGELAGTSENVLFNLYRGHAIDLDIASL